MSEFKERLCKSLGIVNQPGDDELIGRICRRFEAVEGPRPTGSMPKRSDPKGITGPSQRDFRVFHVLKKAIDSGRLPHPAFADECGVPAGAWSWQEVARQMADICERESIRAGDGPLHYMDMQRAVREIAEERDALAERLSPRKDPTDE